jgi:hypothetical protein
MPNCCSIFQTKRDQSEQNVSTQQYECFVFLIKAILTSIIIPNLNLGNTTLLCQSFFERQNLSNSFPFNIFHALQ